MATVPRSHQIAPDAPGYVIAWARDFVAAIGKRERRLVLSQYSAIAGNRRLAKADRTTAAERVKALKSLL